MKMNKKAIFLTLSAFFLLSVILSLAIVYLNYNGPEKDDRVSAIASMDRLYDISSSVKQSITEVLRLYLNMSFIAEKNLDGTYNVMIGDIVSKDGGMLKDEFKSKIDNLKSFIERNDRNTAVNLISLESQELPLVMEDYNITYARNWETGHVILSITPQTLNYNTYDVLINTRDEEIKKVQDPGIKSGSFVFNVRAISNYGQEFIKNNLIDPSQNNQVMIELTDGNQIKVTVNNNMLEIWTNSGSLMESHAKIGNIQPLWHEPWINYFHSAANVTFPESGISREISIDI